MKKKYSLFLLFCCITLTTTSKTNEVILQYSQEDFVFRKDGNGKLFISSQTYSVAYGSDCNEPALPLLRVGYLIGSSESYENVSTTCDEELIFSDVVVAPNPSTIETNSIPEYKVIPINTDYNSKQYPSQGVDYSGTYYMGGYKYITFLVCPYEYDASTKQLYLKTRITLLIQTSKYSVNNHSAKSTPTIAYAGNCLRDNLKKLVVNYEQISELYGDTIVSYNNQSRNSTNYNYLIITNNTLKNAFQPLADWKKTTKGCRGKVLTVEEICNQYTGNSTQVKIKKALKDYYDGTHSGLQFVLLGGDINIVPSQMCYIKTIIVEYHQNTPDTIVKEETTPADLFYACFDNNFNWNANGNDLIGEIGDSVDLSPEIVVTRVPIRKVEQATSFVNRLINYEKNPSIDIWENKMLMGGHKLTRWDEDSILSDAEINADSLYRKYIQPYWTGSRTKMFNTCTGVSSHLFSSTNLQEELKQGYTFVDVTTHGSKYEWQARDYSENYRADSAQYLVNSGSTIITTIACHTNAFDSYCMSEAFMRNANSGVLGYLGCSRENWGYSLPSILGLSFDYNGEFYKELFTNSNGRFGVAVTNAKACFIPLCTSYRWAYRWIMFGLNPIGDPEIPIYLDVPKRFENLKMSFFNGNLSVNTGENNSTICVSSPNDSGSSYYEVQNGTTASFSSVLEGYTVCITKPGFIPFVATCNSTTYIQNETISDYYPVISEKVYVGSDVTSSKPQGEVVIQNGNVEIYGKESVTIKNDFMVQEGATLKVVMGD